MENLRLTLQVLNIAVVLRNKKVKGKTTTVLLSKQPKLRKHLKFKRRIRHVKAGPQAKIILHSNTHIKNSLRIHRPEIKQQNNRLPAKIYKIATESQSRTITNQNI